MAKQRRTVHVLHCVACHRTKCTLSKVGELRLCTDCTKRLKTGESIVAPNKEYIVSVKGNTLYVDKYEEAEEVQACQD